MQAQSRSDGIINGTGKQRLLVRLALFPQLSNELVLESFLVGIALHMLGNINLMIVERHGNKRPDDLVDIGVADNLLRDVRFGS